MEPKKMYHDQSERKSWYKWEQTVLLVFYSIRLRELLVVKKHPCAVAKESSKKLIF